MSQAIVVVSNRLPVVVQTETDGVLVLSEFAGASHQLGSDALLVNPHDTDAVGDAIRNALSMPRAERRRRMANLKSLVEDHDVYRWVSACVSTMMEDPTAGKSRTRSDARPVSVVTE